MGVMSGRAGSRGEAARGCVLPVSWLLSDKVGVGVVNVGDGGPLGGAGGTDRLRWAGRGCLWGEGAGGGILGDWRYLGTCRGSG